MAEIAYRTLVSALAYHRILAAYSVAALARAVGLTDHAIRRLERGGLAEPETVDALARALACTPDDLRAELTQEQRAELEYQGTF